MARFVSEVRALDSVFESESSDSSHGDRGMSSEEESELDRDLNDPGDGSDVESNVGEIGEAADLPEKDVHDDDDEDDDVDEQSGDLAGDNHPSPVSQRTRSRRTHSHVTPVTPATPACDGSSSDSSDDAQDEAEPPARRGRGRARAAAAVRGRGRGRGVVGGGRGRGRGRGCGRGNAHAADDGWDKVDTTPEIPEFTPGRVPGLHLPESESAQPTNESYFFRLFFTTAVVTAIANYTNKYADMKIAEGSHQTYAEADGAWKGATGEEILKLICCLMYMGICRLPHMSDYWSVQPLLNGSWARAFIPTYRRFVSLLAFLKVTDSSTEAVDDKLRKVRFLHDHILSTCMNMWQPGEHVSLDERMVKSKARFSFKQYIKNKPVKFGFKVFALCDSVSKFLVNFRVYTGRTNAALPEHGLAHKTVIDLMEAYSGQGYKLYTDNFYTSPDLYKDLRDNHQCVAVGTCQSNRRGFPTDLRDVKKFQRTAARGSMRFQRTNDDILCLQWKDKRAVTAISTMHRATDFSMVKRKVKENNQVVNVDVKKPQVIEDYNTYMGGVDVFDQYVSSFRVLRKTKKYWKTLFLDFIDVAAVNSYIAFQEYRCAHPEIEELRRSPSYSQVTFRPNVLKQIGGISDDAKVPAVRKGPAPQQPTQPQMHLPMKSEDGKKRNCQYCYVTREHIEQKTDVCCNVCKNRQGRPLHLCFTSERNCFADHHHLP